MYNEYEFQRNNFVQRFATDPRQYRALILTNGLKVLLINDPNTTQSAVSLSISVGAFCDPENVPGISNLCRRMLLLGTNVYPEDFVQFVSNNNGYYSSYTENDHTNFYSAIEPGLFQPLMERFSRCFFEPVFPRDRIVNEINIIDNEYRRNISANIRQLSRLKRIVYNNNLPLNRLKKGSRETLLDIPGSLGINIYNFLVEFYCKWYSAHLMNLAVYSNEELNSLEHMVIALFGRIRNKNIDQPMWCNVIFKDNRFTTKTIVFTKNTKSLNLSFPIPDQRENNKFKPMVYLKSIFEHQGSTSLFAKLKNNGWAEKLSADNKCEARNINFFEIDIKLTNSGVHNIDNIITFVFQYIKMVKSEGIHHWFLEEHMYINQIKRVDKKSPLKFVCSLTPKMINIQLDEVLVAENIVKMWRPDLIYELLLLHLIPRNIRVIVASNTFKHQTTNIEKYYGTPYSTTKIPLIDIQKWEACDTCNNFKMPPMNIFLVKNFNLLPFLSLNEPKLPEIVYESFFLKCWYKRDLLFREPKIFMTIEMLSVILKNDFLSSKILNVLSRLFNDHISKYTYYSTMAGFKINILTQENGLKIQLIGFNETMPRLLKIIVTELFSFKIDPLRFKIIKKEAIRGVKKKIPPYKKAMYYNYLMLSENELATNDLEAVTDIEIEDVKNFSERFFSQLHIETFVYGNIQQHNAIELNKIIENTLFDYARSHTVISGKMERPREVKLNDGEYILFEIVNDHNYKSSGVFINLQCGVQSLHNIMVINLFNQLIKEPCNTILKETENLGYIAESVAKVNYGILHWGVVVQSCHTTEYIQTRIENFIDTIEELLEDMQHSTFDEFKRNFACELSKEPKNFEEQALAYELEIVSREYFFDRTVFELESLSAITKNDVIRFYHNYIHKSGPRRSVLAVYALSKSNNNQSNLEGVGTNNNWIPLSDLEDFKKNRILYPAESLR